MLFLHRRTGSAIPQATRAGTAVLADVQFFAGGGNLGRITRIEADGNDVELIADVECQIAQAVRHTVQDQRAEHRAAVIDRSEDDGLTSESIRSTAPCARSHRET